MQGRRKYAVYLVIWVVLAAITISRVALYSGNNPHRIAWSLLQGFLYLLLLALYGRDMWLQRQGCDGSGKL